MSTQTFAAEQTQITTAPVSRPRATRVHRRVTSRQVSSVPLPTRTHNSKSSPLGISDYEHNNNQSGVVTTVGLPTTSGAIRHSKQHCTRCKESSQYVKALSSRVDKIDQLVQELEKTVERITDPKKFREEHQRKLQRHRGINLKKLSLTELQKLVAVTTGQKPEIQDPQPMDVATPTIPIKISPTITPRPIPAEVAARREREVRKDSGYGSEPEREPAKKHGMSSVTTSGLRISTMSSEQD